MFFKKSLPDQTFVIFFPASTVGPGLADGVKPIFLPGESMEPVVNMENAMVEESLVVTETVPLNSLLGLLTPVPITSVPSHMHTTPPPLLPLMSVSTSSKFDEILEAPQLPPLLFQQPASPVPQSPSLSPCQVLLEIIKEADYPLREGILCSKRTNISFLRENDPSLFPIKCLSYVVPGPFSKDSIPLTISFQHLKYQ